MTAVFPVPGPPEITVNDRVSAVRTACCCSAKS